MAQQKAAVVVLSDPRSPSREESLGRLFNALAAAWDYKTRGDEVTILFQGAGTRWLAEVGSSSHPANALFREVEDKVAGASCGCAVVFGASDDVGRQGFELLDESKVPGTTGLPSLARLTSKGYTVLSF